MCNNANESDRPEPETTEPAIYPIVIAVKDYREASEVVMQRQFLSDEMFITDAMRWLSEKFGDLHLEYHVDSGWQVSSCYAEEHWGDDTWIAGDGTLQGCLCSAVLQSRSHDDE